MREALLLFWVAGSLIHGIVFGVFLWYAPFRERGWIQFAEYGTALRMLVLFFWSTSRLFFYTYDETSITDIGTWIGVCLYPPLILSAIITLYSYAKQHWNLYTMRFTMLAWTSLSVSLTLIYIWNVR